MKGKPIIHGSVIRPRRPRSKRVVRIYVRDESSLEWTLVRDPLREDGHFRLSPF